MPMDSSNENNRKSVMTSVRVFSNIDSDEVKVSPEEIFDMFDKDGDNSISREEYLKMHDALRVLIQSEHEKEMKLAKDVEYQTGMARMAVGKVARANRRIKLLFVFSFSMIVFLLISSALNVVSQWYVGQMIKDMDVAESGMMKVKGTNTIAQTGVATTIGDLSNLLTMSIADLDKVKSITLPVGDAVEMYTITGASMGSGALTLFTARGHEIVIHTNGTRQIHSGGRMLSSAALNDAQGSYKADAGDDIGDGLTCTQALKKVTNALKNKKDKRRGKMKECSPSSAFTYQFSADQTEAANQRTMAATFSSFRVTLEWDLMPTGTDLGVEFNAESYEGDVDTGDDYSFNTERRLGLQDKTTGRRLTSEADLRAYYIANAEQIFPSALYPGMCYDSTFLDAQFTWCVNEGYPINADNYAATTDCVEHYFNSLDANGDPPAVIDPLGGSFPGCGSAGRRLGDRRRMPSGGASCHPARATVELQSGKLARLDDVSVGEYIRTPSGYEPITGFLHADKDAYVTYHQFTTDGGRQIEISDNHWLVVDGVVADPAKATVGQKLTTEEGEQTIASIQKVNALGAYHLLTPSGKYFVNGVAASTYVAYVPRAVWEVVGDGYITLRYRLGLPLLAEGNSPLRHFWFLDVMDTLRIPKSVAYTLFAPLLAASVILTELAATLLLNAPVTTSLLGAAALPALLLTSAKQRVKA